MPANRLTALRALEQVAAILRRLGLAGLVARARQRMLRGLGDFTADVRGIKLSGDTAAHSHYVRQLLDDRREDYIADLFVESISSGALVLDVGAHLGYFSLLAARRGAEVIAFEPNPATLPFLRRNIAANGAEHRITVIEQALGARNETRRFYRAAGGDTSSLHDQGHTVEAIEVAVTTADAVVAGRSVGVVKIDVEGGEIDALDGMRETIADAAPDLRVFIECNPGALEQAGTSASVLVAKLRALGLDPAVADESARALRPVGVDPAEGEPYVNLVCVRAARDAVTSTT